MVFPSINPAQVGFGLWPFHNAPNAQECLDRVNWHLQRSFGFFLLPMGQWWHWQDVAPEYQWYAVGIMWLERRRIDAASVAAFDHLVEWDPDWVVEQFVGHEVVDMPDAGDGDTDSLESLPQSPSTPDIRE